MSEASTTIGEGIIEEIEAGRPKVDLSLIDRLSCHGGDFFRVLDTDTDLRQPSTIVLYGLIPTFTINDFCGVCGLVSQ